MGKTLGRAAAFVALWRALTAANRGGPGLGRRLAALPRMIIASVTRRYDGLWRVLLMAAGVAYVAWPLDAVPELLLPFIGFVDDLVVVTWLAGAILSESERFLEWERRRAAVIPGQVTGPGAARAPGAAVPDELLDGAQ